MYRSHRNKKPSVLICLFLSFLNSNFKFSADSETISIDFVLFLINITRFLFRLKHVLWRYDARLGFGTVCQFEQNVDDRKNCRLCYDNSRQSVSWITTVFGFLIFLCVCLFVWWYDWFGVDFIFVVNFIKMCCVFLLLLLFYVCSLWRSNYNWCVLWFVLFKLLVRCDGVTVVVIAIVGVPLLYSVKM